MKLKIRDDVDMEILEKYGFHKTILKTGTIGYRHKKYWILERDRLIRIPRDASTNKIYKEDNTLDGVIYDLFWNCLVEKVEGE